MLEFIGLIIKMPFQLIYEVFIATPKMNKGYSTDKWTYNHYESESTKLGEWLRMLIVQKPGQFTSTPKDFYCGKVMYERYLLSKEENNVPISEEEGDDFLSAYYSKLVKNFVGASITIGVCVILLRNYLERLSVIESSPLGWEREWAIRDYPYSDTTCKVWIFIFGYFGFCFVLNFLKQIKYKDAVLRMFRIK